MIFSYKIFAHRTTKSKQQCEKTEQNDWIPMACLGGAVNSVAVRAAVIGESGFEAQAGRIIVSSYSSVCFEIKFSGRHDVLFNL